ncbi:MAG: NAD(P)H-dependent glycerol-3-phosphate dehydrogenase [Burkholderiales bacterium]|nr:NAD(P)H-dependent glycerol-3-phosphate dehydrogenase [Burkholderiales bacterium]MDE2457285.1 NAD(P)H-dependent glycerol-3-phosphate dehydrogenase [Burkholderiales bacterium]
MAAALRRSGCEVSMWTRRFELSESIRRHRLNSRHLPGIGLPAGLRATTELDVAIEGAQGVIVAVPSSAVRETVRAAAALIRALPVLVASKGVERRSGALMTQVVHAECGEDTPAGVISGPSFADEVARGLPTRLTLAYDTLEGAPSPRAGALAIALRRALGSIGIGLEFESDAIGVQVAGALKNVVAVACGMARALELGENARAAIVSRGLVDMRRLTLALGGDAATLWASSGAGDLFLTAGSTSSRNTRAGMRLARGGEAHGCGELAEGLVSCEALRVLEGRLGLDLQVARAVREVLAGQAEARSAVLRLICPEGEPAPAASHEAALLPAGS